MIAQLPVFSFSTFPRLQVIRESNTSASTVFVMIENIAAVDNAEETASVAEEDRNGREAHGKSHSKSGFNKYGVEIPILKLLFFSCSRPFLVRCP